MTTTARQRSTLGAYGEALAARHLTDEGMVLLDKNWRCELGEIDLVLRDGRVLVVCEVKTRSSLAFGTPLEAVTEQKAARLRRLAARWLADHELRPPEVRIDLVGVLVPASGPVELDHVRGVA
jgi:putative endonuclease